MKSLIFSKRVLKEILRDPLNLIFGALLPVALLFLFSAIQAKVPVPLFNIESITPGLAVFGLSFLTLFSSLIIAKDRESALLQRLYTTPLTSRDFIFGYTLPLLPVALLQSIALFIIAVILGLPVTVTIIYDTLFLIPISLFFISLGLLCGSVFTVKQVGGICGALITNLTALLSGVWFDLDLIGGAFKKFAYALPFVHAVEIERSVLAGSFENILPHFLVIIIYDVITFTVAVLLFLRQMRNQ